MSDYASFHPYAIHTEDGAGMLRQAAAEYRSLERGIAMLVEQRERAYERAASLETGIRYLEGLQAEALKVLTNAACLCTEPELLTHEAPEHLHVPGGTETIPNPRETVTFRGETHGEGYLP